MPRLRVCKEEEICIHMRLVRAGIEAGVPFFISRVMSRPIRGNCSFRVKYSVGFGLFLVQQ